MCPIYILRRMVKVQKLVENWAVSSHVQSRLGKLVVT
jgi:hypothetical protein